MLWPNDDILKWGSSYGNSYNDILFNYLRTMYVGSLNDMLRQYYQDNPGASSDGMGLLVGMAGGALYLPDTNTCWQDFAGTAGAYDKKVALIESEPARAHNYLINSVFAGASVTPTNPTGWTRTTSGFGLTYTIIAVGTSTISIRVQGTASETNTGNVLAILTANAPAAKAGEVWFFAYDYTITGTYLANRVTGLIIERDGGGTFLSGSGNTIAASGSGRLVYTRNLNQATTAKITCAVQSSFTNGDVLDYTITISNVQLERNQAHAYCPTYGTAIEPQATYFAAWQTTTNYQPYLRSANYSELPFTSGTGETWTTTRTWIDDAGGIEWENGEAYWRNPAGTAGNYASTPDSAAASITGDLTLIVKITRANGVAAQNCVIGKYNPTGNNRSYRLIVTSTDNLALVTTPDGSTAQTGQTTNAVDFTAGKYFTVMLDVDDGLGNQVYTFKQSSDGINWTTLASSGTVSGTTSIYDGTAAVEIGAYNNGAAEVFAGKIHYAAAWANTTGTGTPAWEFHPTRDAVKPASPWLDFDGTDDYLISSIIPGNYSEGFICAGAVQTEAIGAINSIVGTSVNNAVHGIAVYASIADGRSGMWRYNGTSDAGAITTNTLTKDVPFAITAAYAVSAASIQRNAGAKDTSATANDYTGTTQYALIGASNNTESGVSLAGYIKGHIHALAWLPSIPTEVQGTALRNYVASKTGVTL